MLENLLNLAFKIQQTLAQKSKLKMEYIRCDVMNSYIYVGLKHQIFAVLVSIVTDAVAALALISPVSDVSEFKSPAINTEKRLERGRRGVISKRTVRRSTFVCGSGHCYRTVQP